MTNLPATVRQASAADAASIHAIYAPIVKNTSISFEIVPPTVEDMAKRVDDISKRYPYLVAERGNHMAGYAYASQHKSRGAYSSSVDVTVYVAEHARRSGIGRTLYAELIGRLVKQGFHAAFAGIALPNDASVGLHETMGFTPVGVYREVGFKFGNWIDVGWWQRILSE